MDQLTLLDVPAKQRRPPRVVDGGYIDGTGECVQWWCLRCGHETDWQPAPPPPLPCPRCNVEGLEDE